jgi:hypothetical protein
MSKDDPSRGAGALKGPYEASEKGLEKAPDSDELVLASDPASGGGTPSIASAAKGPLKAPSRPSQSGSTRKRGTRKEPANKLDISILARRRVRKMIRILDEIASGGKGDEKIPASARVSAAKELISLAKMDPDELRGLPDDQLYAVLRAMAKLEGKKFEKELLKAVEKEERSPQGGSHQGFAGKPPAFAGRTLAKSEVEALEKAMKGGAN